VSSGSNWLRSAPRNVLVTERLHTGTNKPGNSGNSNTARTIALQADQTPSFGRVNPHTGEVLPYHNHDRSCCAKKAHGPKDRRSAARRSAETKALNAAAEMVALSPNMKFPPEVFRQLSAVLKARGMTFADLRKLGAKRLAATAA
jgi:hypothetical protein